MGEGLRIKPITFKTASEYVNKYHRHHRSSIGCKFCIGVFDGDVMHGVAICGRPVSRVLDDGATCEITRVCTDGARNACSMLYGACQRIAREMGYEQIITYTLVSEGGASLKASNFHFDGIVGGTHWTGARNKGQSIPKELKKRWSMKLR